jgi:8-oxo-dGTP diphosphatase
MVARRMPGGELGGLWEFPGGKLEAGESDEDALVREFEEEFGASLEPRSLIGETSFMHHGRNRALAAWVCRVDRNSELRLCEHIESRWLSLGEIELLELVDSDRKLLPFIRAWLKAASRRTGPHA